LTQSPDGYIKIFAAVDEFYDYFANELELRRSEPRDDLLSDLVAARMDGEEPLTVDEMLQMLVQFLVAGNETTTNMISTIVFRLATDPVLQAQVRADTSLIKPLVEEMLRLESPVQGLFRTTTRDTELAGQQLPAGAMVWLVYGSANRDSAVFDSPDTVVLDEDRPPHLAFARGEHFCLGANLARLELRVALEALLDRFSDFTFVGDPDSVDYHASFILRGVAKLPLQMTGRAH
jgi:cytochrome P450